MYTLLQRIQHTNIEVLIPMYTKGQLITIEHINMLGHKQIDQDEKYTRLYRL